MIRHTTLFFLFTFFISESQIPSIVTDSIQKPYLMIVGDTITNSAINLSEVVILPKLRIKSKEDQRRYLILKRKTIKVYPYAKLAAERLQTLNERIKTSKANANANNTPDGFKNLWRMNFLKSLKNLRLPKAKF